MKKSKKPEVFDSPEVQAALEKSFSRNLSSVGQKVLCDLELTLLQRCGNGKWDSYLAPMVSLCQSSGSGKSKISVELLKRRPGYYIVFREDGQTGYPKANANSKILFDFVAEYKDENNDLSDISWNECTVGKILNLFAIIVIQYYRNFLAHYKVAGKISETTAYLASKFDKNDDPAAFNQEYYIKLYRRVLKIDKRSITVNDISTVIKFVIDDPKIVFDQDELKKLLLIDFNWIFFQKYPFIFVIDEAETLAKLYSDRKLNGFGAFRRAMSYLTPGTRIIVLTLGTKSDIIDLNPPVVDNSKRMIKRSKMPLPIVFRGNLNIFAEDPAVKNIKLKYDFIRSPLYFRHLCIIGHSIWSSLPVNTVIELARDKLLNGTADKFFYVPVLWMILTGLAANPLSVDAGKYVASHMGYLVQLSNDLKKLIVMYPSEPILAIAAHTLIDDLDTDRVFQVLHEKFESVDIDRGYMAEIFGAFILLRCSWTCKVLAAPDNLLPVDPSFTLQRSVSSSSQRIPASDYRVHTVEYFLEKLVSSAEVPVSALGLPEDILEGLINYTHFIPISWEFTENHVAHIPCTDDFEIKHNIFPMADNRINDISRNVLSKGLLKLCLLNFAAIRCPPGMYGFDLIIPVLLKPKVVGPTDKDDDVTFIGVQIKRSSAGTGANVRKMQARLHMIKCSDPVCKGQCDNCVTPESLERIYKNQLTILISLDEEDTYDYFMDSENFFPGCTIGDREFFKTILKTGKVPTYPLQTEKRQSKRTRASPSKSDVFMTPLVQVRRALSSNLLVSAALWQDQFVDLKKAFKDKHYDVKPDGYVHRQFTVYTRGWKIFRKFLAKGRSSFEYESIANNLMNQPILSRFLDDEKTPSMARSIVHDLSPIFIFASDQIGSMMGKPSNLAAMDTHIQNNHEAMMENMANMVKSDFPLLILGNDEKSADSASNPAN